MADKKTKKDQEPEMTAEEKVRNVMERTFGSLKTIMSIGPVRVGQLLDYKEIPGDKNEFNQAAAKMFVKLGVKPEDVKDLSNSNGLTEALKQVSALQAIEDGHNAAMTAFEKWQKNRGIKD